MQVKKYEYYLERFNEILSNFIKSFPTTDVVKDACVYSLNVGGKRIRPILCLATADMLGISEEDVKHYALAIEMIHTYSLVHDDLEVMDNDDYRRGKLSTHKKYGEAFGVLCGDALLNLSIETCLKKCNMTANDFDAIRVIYDYSGVNGMIYGQTLDILGERLNDYDEKYLKDIFINKTSKLLTAPLLVCSALKDKLYYDVLKEYGEKLGLLFQISDDILDVEGTLESIGKTPNKDSDENKITAIKIYGHDGAKEQVAKLYNDCISLLKTIPNSDFLIDLTTKIYKRKK